MINDFNALTKEYLALFQAEWFRILEKVDCNQKQLVAGSKLRPQIVLWGYLAGVNWNGELNLQVPAYAAVSVELIHKASLLLDDWIDDDDERHGEHAFHVDYGEHIAAMTAMKMVAESINHLLLSDQGNDLKLTTIRLLMQTATTMTNGVLAELALDDETMFDLDLIKRIAQMETSEIIGNALLIGYALGGNANDILAMYLKKIGDLSGYLFQTLNDLESFSNAVMNRQYKGRENFDFNRNRKNIVVAYMYSLLSEKEQKEMTYTDTRYVVSLYEKHHIKRLILREMELVFSEIETLIKSMVEHGAPEEWVEGYAWFIHLLMQVASKRVSWDK